MFESLKNTRLIRGSQILGLQAYSLPDGNYEYDFVLLKKKKNKLIIDKKASGITDLKNALSQIPTGIPVYLIIDGKGVIHKKINLLNKENESSILSQILPNANPDEFFLQLTHAGSLKFVSLVRIKIISELIALLKECNFQIVDVSLGPFGINRIYLFLENKNLIDAGGYQLFFENGSVSDFLKKENRNTNHEYLIGNEKLDEKYLVSFAGGFAYLFPDENKPATHPLLLETANEYYHKKIFLLAGKTILAFFFLLFLINFLLYSHFDKKHNEYSARASQNAELLNRLDTLTRELKQKEAFLLESGLLSPSRLSYFADRIALNLPEKIILTQLNINGLEKKLKNETAPEFLLQTIHVSGYSSNSTLLNDWVKTLNKEKWVQKILVLNYNQENANSPGKFKIEIKTYPENV